MPARRGLVVEVDKSGYVVLTPDGAFCRVPRDGRAILVGEEISYEERRERNRPHVRSWLVAACLALAVIVGLCYPFQPAVAYWVSLDINPSLELGVNSCERVVRVVPLNAAAEKLVSQQRIKGRKVEQALGELLARSADLGLLKETGEVVAVAVAEKQEPSRRPELSSLENREKLTETLETSLNRLQIKANVVVTELPAPAHAEARRVGLSAGQFAVWQALKQSGVTLDPAEVKARGLGQLTREQKCDLRALLAQPKVEKKGASNTQVSSSGSGSGHAKHGPAVTPVAAGKQDRSEKKLESAVRERAGIMSQTQDRTPGQKQRPQDVQTKTTPWPKVKETKTEVGSCPSETEKRLRAERKQEKQKQRRR